MLSTKTKKYIVLTCLLLVPIFILTIGEGSSVDPPNNSNTYFHRIDLRSNKDLDDFVKGNGTSGLSIDTAHIIENFSIQTSTNDYGIFIQNIDRYLIIRNCKIIATDTAFSEKSGIEIRLSENIMIQNCSVSYHEVGIYFLDVKDCTIYSSITSYNLEAGIKLLESDNNVICNNSIYNNLGYGIYLKRSHENLIANNTVEENLDIEIYDRGNYNEFENNTSEPVTKIPFFSKTWLWVILAVGGAVFFICGLMAFVTWRGR